MRAMRGDELLAEAGIDFLKIDVEGAELLVLENATRTLEDVLVLETEVEFVPLYKQQCLFGDLHRFLHDRGLVMHKLLEVAAVITRNTRRIRLYLASHWPSADVFAHAMSQLRSP